MRKKKIPKFNILGLLFLDVINTEADLNFLGLTFHSNRSKYWVMHSSKFVDSYPSHFWSHLDNGLVSFIIAANIIFNMICCITV